MSKNKKRKEYVRPVYPKDGLLPCACSAGIEKHEIEPDPCHYDTWDVGCLHCGARTSQFATRAMALTVWNAMATAVAGLKEVHHVKLCESVVENSNNMDD